MVKPNFFIVGAPKSGTSSLYKYLQDHPFIFLPWLKEPFYFLTDHPNMRAITTLDDYLALYREAGDGYYRAIGEASTLYLSSPTALKNVREFNNNARIIVMLRNPIELVNAFHSQLLFTCDEDEPSFERAWRLQSQRRMESHIPPECRDASLLQYARMGHLGRQVEELLQIFPHKQVQLILFDDFRESTQEVYEDVLCFLDVPSDNRTNFPRFNANRRHKSRRIGAWLMKPPRALLWLREKLKLTNTGFFRALTSLNASQEARPTLSSELKGELVEVFRRDIQRLSEILDRDLSHWIDDAKEK